MQILQKAALWCPNAEKVFVSPTGQIVDPATVQQQASSDPGNDDGQAQGKAPPTFPLRLPKPTLLPGLERSFSLIMSSGTTLSFFSHGSTNQLCICDDVTCCPCCSCMWVWASLGQDCSSCAVPVMLDRKGSKAWL